MKKMMKVFRLILIIGALLGLILIVSALISKSKTDDKREVIRYSGEVESEYVLENDRLILKMETETCSFILTDKQTGVTWNSVPEGIDEDALADTRVKNMMRSAIVVTSTTISGVDSTYDSYKYALEQRTFSIEASDESITVNYYLSPNSRIYLIPDCISETRFKELTGMMEKSVRSVVSRNYRKIDINKLSANDDKEELLQICPGLADEPHYFLPPVVSETVVYPAYILEQLEEAFASVGYTEEEYQSNLSALKEEVSKAEFNVTVVYRLDEDSLVVEIPGEKIAFNPDYPIESIQLLPYFCSGGIEDEGYLVVPDGGGAQIDFNNGKTKYGSYYANVYGWDENLQRNDRIQDTDAQFPVFGAVRNGNYLLAIPECGKGDLSLEADIAGKRGSLNYCKPIFTIIHGEATEISAKSDVSIHMFQNNYPTGTYGVNYYLGDSDSYVEMANRYRDYLLKEYDFLGQLSREDYLIAIEMVGGIDSVHKVMGMPIRLTTTATDYAEAYAILEDLQSKGINNLYLRYASLLNGGMSQSSLQKVKGNVDAGSGNELQKLLQLAEQMSSEVYLGGYVQMVNKTEAFDGFSKMSDGIRKTDQTVVKQYFYLQSSQSYSLDELDAVYLLNLAAMMEAMGNLSEEAKDRGFAGAGFLDIGDLLYSDFKKNDEVFRDDMIDAIQAQLMELRGGEQGVMLSGGNDYAAVYADCFTDLQLRDSGYDLIDRAIPFYQIALHGLVNYTGSAINTSANPINQILASVETGAGLYYTFFEMDYKELIGNRFTYNYDLYSANYTDWADGIAEVYCRLNTELGHTASMRIIDHYYLSEDVTVTVYEDGTRVFVNYSDSDYITEVGTVLAKDWLTVGGG